MMFEVDEDDPSEVIDDLDAAMIRSRWSVEIDHPPFILA